MMRVPNEEDEEAPVETAAQVERNVVQASEEAIRFITSVEPSELQKCLFSDSLATLSEGGREIGEFRVSVDLAVRRDAQQQQQQQQVPCVRLRASSCGAADTPCGTRVTAYLSAAMETLEQDLHEYVKLPDHSTERRCHMVQQGQEMVVDWITAMGEEVTQQTHSYSLSSVRGLQSEASSLLLMRVMAMRRARSLGVKQLAVGRETVEVFGVERTVEGPKMVPTHWRCYFLADGHLASRKQVGLTCHHEASATPPPTAGKGCGKCQAIICEDTSGLGGGHGDVFQVPGQKGGTQGGPRLVPPTTPRAPHAA
ncbi:hypothetical protein CRUP_025923, partial [Coryphaenoides rupestris]